MADNFDMKQYLVENKLGAYSKLKETEEGYMGTQYDSSEDMAVDMVKKGITEEPVKEGADVFADIEDDISYGTESKQDAIEYLKEIISFCQKKIADIESGDWELDETKKPVEEVSKNELMIIDRIEEIVSNLARNISTSSNIPTQEKIGLVEALKELKEYVEDLGAEVEMNETKKPVEEALSPDYIDRMEGLANIQNLAIFKDKLKSLASDWMKEGFDKEDVVEYIDYVLNSSVSETKKPVEEAASTRDIAMALGSDEPEVDSLVLRFLQGISKKFGLSMFQTTLLVKERIKKLGY